MFCKNLWFSWDSSILVTSVRALDWNKGKHVLGGWLECWGCHISSCTSWVWLHSFVHALALIEFSTETGELVLMSEILRDRVLPLCLVTRCAAVAPSQYKTLLNDDIMLNLDFMDRLESLLAIKKWGEGSWSQFLLGSIGNTLSIATLLAGRLKRGWGFVVTCSPTVEYI